MTVKQKILEKDDFFLFLKKEIVKKINTRKLNINKLSNIVTIMGFFIGINYPTLKSYVSLVLKEIFDTNKIILNISSNGDIKYITLIDNSILTNDLHLSLFMKKLFIMPIMYSDKINLSILMQSAYELGIKLADIKDDDIELFIFENEFNKLSTYVNIHI